MKTNIEKGNNPSSNLEKISPSVEVVVTLDTIRKRISDTICEGYVEGSEHPQTRLQRGENLLEVLKIALDGCVGKREIELDKIHGGPYTLKELKEAILKISGSYHHNFSVDGYQSAETLIQSWVRNFPSPEVAADEDFMNSLASINFSK